MHNYVDVLIVGAGHGGAHTALTLRQLNYEGSIAVIGDEPHTPYERPPLSKEYLCGTRDFERMSLRPRAFWKVREVNFLLNRRVVAVDPLRKTVTSHRGEHFVYHQLVWAAGGRPRMLAIPGVQLRGVNAVRTRGDIDSIRSQLATVTNVVIIGGGYIGLETAAAFVKMGKNVALLEALPRVLARVAGEPLSRFYEQEHRAQGVDIRLNVNVEAIEGEVHVTGVRLTDGQTLPADLMIVGIGIISAIEALAEAGAETVTNGVAVDLDCRTTLPDIFAIGDCASQANAFAGRAKIRIESVQNAYDQATTVAHAIVGKEHVHRAAPWFWSTQYDLKLQTVGLSLGYTGLVLRGDVTTRSFSIVYLKAGQVIALDCVNQPKDFMQGRGLILKRLRVDEAKLADTRIPLAALLNEPLSA